MDKIISTWTRVCGIPAVCLATSVYAETAADPHASASPGVDIIEVVFDKKPVEKGLSFDRTVVKPVEVELKGKKYQAWVAEKSIEPARGWTRSFRFRVTDPLFQNNGRPVVDVEVEYHLPANTGIAVMADTERGAKRVGGGKGKTDDWRTARFRINGAYFGARSDPKDKSLDGFDLRIDGTNGGLYLRRVRLIGYDPKQNVQWKEMITVESLSASRPGGVLAFPQATDQQVQVAIGNYAKLERPLRYEVQIGGYDDKIRHRSAGQLTMGASQSSLLKLTFDTTGWPLGPYDGTLRLLATETGAEPLQTRSFRLGVVSGAKLDKARPGEFLYGLDPANSYIYPTHTPTAFAYYRLMGVDILRTLFDKDMPETAEHVGNALAVLGAEDVQSMVFVGVPKEENPQSLAKRVAPINAFLKEIARLYVGSGPGKLCYFEIGNEPDLTGFFPGTMPEYTEVFVGMFNAIKQGAKEGGKADKDTVVMNGGLSFFGASGNRRSLEFIEIVPRDKIDAIGYHGHGAGIEKERRAYERTKAAAVEFGKGDLPLIATENGYSGTDRQGLVEQARTAVEKFTFAHSKGLPTLIFFRLFMEGKGSHDGGYGMTDNFVEPRPSVMSFRHLVERLRHHRFVKALDFKNMCAVEDVNVFLFEKMDSAGKPTEGKAVVAFAERSGQVELRLRLGQVGRTIREARLFDMYGNELPLSLQDAEALLPLRENPLYLTWKSTEDIDVVQAAAPLLSVGALEPLLVNASSSLSVLVRNPGSKPLDAELSIEPHSRLKIQVRPPQEQPRKLTLPTDKTVSIPVELELSKADHPLSLPRWWKVFPDVDYTQLSPEQLSTLPDSLPGVNGAASGQFVWSQGGTLDLAKVVGGYALRRPAMVYAYLDSPRAIDLPCGAGADWFMAWYVNGEKVLDTLDKGNEEHAPISRHPFTLSLKAGRNVLAVVVLSGSGGWDLKFGGPKDLAIAKGGSDPDNLTITLSAEGKVLSRQVVPLELQAPVPPLDALVQQNSLSSWMPLEPLAELGGETVKNFWMEAPDQSRWYRGGKDLSGLAWIRDDAANIHIAVAVTDDTNTQAPSTSQLANHDSLRIVLANDAGQTCLDTTIGLVGDRPQSLNPAPGVVIGITPIKPNGDGATMFYHVVVPKSVLEDQPFRLSLVVADNDGGFLKQTSSIGNVTEPRLGRRLVLE